ncbi:hypothetical protein [Cecembia lonarensis]|uniref:Uncharacterized protein n=1 Tax=Cecembia lonarensis (strain CCUG 58316 / KCTC 22772 / LW9) TaxID=1225176 RepID=K1L8Y8_CECL9|nr:hypothetical protein [Cecembia lonarensis]EKB48637.1 hypothetical protein B879_02727 [Cecembia lonarensis LW9]
MRPDLITQTLKTYVIQKGKDLKVIQRYLSVKYKLVMDEKVLLKRLENLS